MIKRTLTTIVLWSVLIALLWFFGIHAAVILTALLAVGTLHEFYIMLERVGQKPFHRFGLILGAIIVLGPYAVQTLFSEISSADAILSVLAAAVVLCSLRILAERDPGQRIDTLAATVFGLIYVPFLFHFVVKILYIVPDETAGILLAVWIILVAKFCDVGALLVGSAIGRTKMAPNISPKKTWEGAIGGLLIGSGIGAAFVAALSTQLPAALTWKIAFLAGLPIAALGIVSDLIESMLKRRADMKDSGITVPGIGGVFDLTDSILLTAPAGYFLLSLIL